MGNLENLVFQSTAEGEYYTYLIQYGLTKEELEALDVGEGAYEDDGTIWIPIDVDVDQFDDVLTSKLVYYCFTSLSLVTNTAHNGELHGTSADGSCASFDWCLGTKTWKAKSRCALFDDGEYPDDPTPGGGGGGGGGDGEPNEEDPWEYPDTDIHNGPLLTSPNSGNGSGSAQTDDPCKILNNAMKNDYVKAAIQYLKTKTNEKIEYGYEIEYKYNSNDQEYQHDPILRTSTTDNLSISLATGGHVQGGGHNHPIEGLPIPSWGDIRWTYICEDNNSVFNDGTAYSMVVVKDPANTNNTITYAITINDFNALSSQINAEMNEPKILRQPILKDKLDRINEKFGNKFIDIQDDSEALEKKFLQVYANYGIDLYKRNEQTNNWEQLKIENNELTPNPCGN